MRESQKWALELAFELGLSVAGCAAASGLSPTEVWYAWSVRTGLPTPVDPIPSTIRQRCREVQRGWTEDMRLQAERGITARASSHTIAYRLEARRAEYRRYEQVRRERSESSTRPQGGAVHHDPGGDPVGRRGGEGSLDRDRAEWDAEGSFGSGGSSGAGDLSDGALATAGA